MSVPLREEKRSEAPLITFTLCVPAAVGVVVLSALFELVASFGGRAGSILRPSLLLLLAGGSALGLTVAGMLASMAHLAKPIRAPFSLRHLQSSWLSREIAAVALFGACVVVWVGGASMDAVLCAFVGLLGATISGIALLFVIARAYKMPTRPAWLGSECLIELVAVTCGAGAAVFLLCLALYAVMGTSDVSHCIIDGRASSIIVCVGVSCALMAAGTMLGAYAHKSRYRRLLSIREISDERITLTLENYERLKPVVRKVWWIEFAAVVVGLIGSCLYLGILISDGSSTASIVPVVVLYAAATTLEFVAHGMQRWLFYEIPVPVKYTAFLRK